ncbi:MAG: hypothetical protein HQL80_09400 [Magnetococcales bacterium]|nr:hypothetical protein [Magnetococcales bacterium]
MAGSGDGVSGGVGGAAVIVCGEWSEWHGGRAGVSDRDSKVIGYYAQFPNREVLCTMYGAYIISGSLEVIQNHVLRFGDKPEEMTFKKMRFGEILKGLRLGAEYSFDEDSYKRFRPLAKLENVSTDELEAYETDNDNKIILESKTIIISI